MEPLFIILAVLALLLGRSAAAGRPARTNTVLHKKRGSDSNLSALVTACLGDRAKAQRLIEYEKRRAPGITEAEAVRRAVERLTVDRGR